MNSPTNFRQACGEVRVSVFKGRGKKAKIQEIYNRCDSVDCSCFFCEAVRQVHASRWGRHKLASN
jgi:hypothetical protein